MFLNVLFNIASHLHCNCLLLVHKLVKVYCLHKLVYINWLNVRKELDSFINQLRYFANNTFQKGKEVEVAEITPNQRTRKS